MLTADGVVSLIGCLMGNPFINAVYIGHPGWKAMGGRIGYSAATGVMVIVLSWFGVIAVMLVADPGGRDLADPALHRHADRRAGVPGDAEGACAGDRAGADAATSRPGARLLIDGALGAAGTNAATVGFDKLGQVGVLYHGLEVLGGGAILAGLVLGAIAVFIIDRKFAKASAFAAAGAVLTFFGFMHGESVGIAVTPTVALAYAMVAAFLFALSRSPAIDSTSKSLGDMPAAAPAE